ncbi:unnamed protein product [Schistosoma mattheei]|uniref:MAM domain-containing protein n=1 Tax=Schistosoma mattheei TaxID=31246 RepID=A0AA85BCF1_9TREM|nr:unnamed protein product [Schistosoma mattheei]
MKIVCSILFLFALSVKADFQVKPMHICTFDGSLCGWMNDMNTWKHQWKLVTNKQSISSNEQLSTSMLCMNANEATPDDWFNSFPPSDLRSLSNPKMNKPVQTRLWSPPIQAKHKLHCLTFMYHVDIGVKQALLNKQRDEKPSLTMLRRQEGSCITVQKGLNGDTSLTCDNKGLFKSGNQISSSEWSKVMIDLPPTNTDYKLILEGTIPAGYPDARICVDNITSYTEPCSALEKASAPLPSQWSWAQYFGLTFVGALILGLLIPVLFLVILIWACRRRHHAMHSNYTNSKLFSTNLWYYIGGKEICDDPNGFRGSSSLLRSKQFNSPSATGTLLNGGGGHHLMLSNADVMDLPDVVVPGGRVVAFNYSGNTLGGNTLRHNHNNAGYTNTNYLSNAQNGQVMLTNVNGTVSLNNCGTNVTTVARTGQNAMPLVSNELIQQQSQSQQQNETYNYQTNPVFGESASMALMTASQSPMLMTQSMAPNYGSEANHIAQSNFSNANTQQINQLNSNGQVYNKPAVPPAQQQHQPRAQSQYFPRPNNLKRI